jgi:hypothetical protein
VETQHEPPTKKGKQKEGGNVNAQAINNSDIISRYGHKPTMYNTKTKCTEKTKFSSVKCTFKRDMNFRGYLRYVTSS